MVSLTDVSFLFVDWVPERTRGFLDHENVVLSLSDLWTWSVWKRKV